MHSTYSEQESARKREKHDARAIIIICAITLGSLLGAFVKMV